MIRKAEKKDISNLCRICQNALGYPECTEDKIEKGLSRIDESREQVFVCEESGKTVGFVHVELYGCIYFDLLANILGLAVLDEYQHKGYGKELMSAAEEWAKEKNVSAVRVISGISRTNAHEFYEHLGYKSEKMSKRFLKNI